MGTKRIILEMSVQPVARDLQFSGNPYPALRLERAKANPRKLYTLHDLERAKAAVRAAESLTEGLRGDNRNRKLAALKRAIFELSMIEDHLRGRGLLQRSRPVRV